MTAETIRIGIDLGGTKTELIALDAAGYERLRLRRPTPGGDYAATLQLIEALVREAEAKLGARASVGLGTPGAISQKTGRMKNCNSTCLNGKPLKEDVERLLARDVRIANDADCFALSEATDGAGRGASTVFGVILGTGVGGGIVVRGQLLEGVNRIAGEWGHNALPWPQPEELPGPACYCGRHGCVETWLSGSGMSADHRRVTGMELPGEEIAVRAAQGDIACCATLERYTQRLARAFAQVINILDPEAIVLGGGVANIGMLYEVVPQLWGEWVFSDEVRTRLLPNRHGDSSGVRGAAWLWGNE